MKGHILTFLTGVVVLTAALLPNAAGAQAVCLTDDGGFAWDMTLSNNHFTGTVDVPNDPDFDWYATGGRGTNGATRRHHTFTAINPELSTDPGCGDDDFNTDWFTYNGLASGFNGTGYPISGTWVNSCGFTGTFTGLITLGACPGPRVAGPPVSGGPASATAPQAAVEARTSAQSYALSSYPNPANDAATISYTIPERSAVEITVYDALGRQVAVLVDAEVEAGTHTAVLDASSLPAGTYVYRIVAGSYTEARNLVLVR